jgi:hypothetical protein
MYVYMVDLATSLSLVYIPRIGYEYLMFILLTLAH